MKEIKKYIITTTAAAFDRDLHRGDMVFPLTRPPTPKNPHTHLRGRGGHSFWGCHEIVFFSFWFATKKKSKKNSAWLNGLNRAEAKLNWAFLCLRFLAATRRINGALPGHSERLKNEKKKKFKRREKKKENENKKLERMEQPAAERKRGGRNWRKS